MKYAVIKVINGNYAIHAETKNLNSAIFNFHSLCSVLWNSEDVITANVCIVNEHFGIVNGYNEHIYHETETEIKDKE